MNDDARLRVIVISTPQIVELMRDFHKLLEG